jgi:hypothetical protein
MFFNVDTIRKPCAYIKVLYDNEIMEIYTADGYRKKFVVCNARYSGLTFTKGFTVTEGDHDIIIETGEIKDNQDISTDTFKFTITTSPCPISISCSVVGSEVVIKAQVNKADTYVLYANDKPFDTKYLDVGSHTLKYPVSKFPTGRVTISVRRLGARF